MLLAGKLIILVLKISMHIQRSTR